MRASISLASQAGVGLLDHVLGVGQGAEESVCEIDELAPLTHDHAQARIEPVVWRLRLGGHGVDAPVVASACISSTRQRAEV